LITRGGHLVEKSELLGTVWADAFVEEGNLTVAISTLRKALGDDGAEHKYIQTVAGRGYRFVGDVHEIELGTGLAASGAPGSSLSPDVHSPEGRRSNILKITLVALGVLGLGVVIFLVRFGKPIGAQGATRSLAVLPFGTLDADPANDYLGLGLADAIITRLGRNGNIIVRPTSAVMRYANSRIDPLEIGRSQKVDSILVGNISALPERVRVTVQLVRVKDGALLWADVFEGSPRQMFALEDKMAAEVARSMSVPLSRQANARLGLRDTENSKAYQLYLKGRYFWNKRTVEGLRRSIEYFEQATVEDPNYALAYAGLADAYVLLDSYGVESSQQAYPQARAAALKALQLDDSLAESHASLGMVSFFYEWNWTEAEHEFQRAIELDPNYAMVRSWYALDLLAMGRSDEALNQAQRALELDPLSLIVNTEVGWIYYSKREYPQAIDTFQKVIDLDRQFARAHTRLGMVYAAERNFGDAIREFKTAQELSGPDAYVDGLLGYAEALSGNPSATRKLLDELTKRSRLEYVPSFSIALICEGLGERDSALTWLAKSFQDRSTYMVYVKTDPLLDAVRSDPQFAKLIARMGLADTSFDAIERKR